MGSGKKIKDRDKAKRLIRMGRFYNKVLGIMMFSKIDINVFLNLRWLISWLNSKFAYLIKIDVFYLTICKKYRLI